MKAPRCINLGAGTMHAGSIRTVIFIQLAYGIEKVGGLEYCAAVWKDP